MCEPLERRALFTSAALLTASAGTAPVGDLLPDAAAGNVLYATRAAPTPIELWRTDGSTTGTYELQTLTAAPTDVTPFGTGVAYVVGATLYITNGEPNAARPLYTASRGLFDASGDPAAFYVSAVAGRLWFSCGDGLYVSDGTPAGTKQVLGYATDVPHFATPDGTAYFITAAPDSTHLPSLARTDGTPAGTATLGYASAVVGTIGATVLYDVPAGFPGTEIVYHQLWAYDGTTSVQLSATPSGFDQGDQCAIGDGAMVGGAYCFTASDPDTVDQPSTLWRTDGTVAGTTPIAAANLTAATGDQPFHDFVSAGGRAYFETGQPVYGSAELWTTDGTAAGTVQLLVIGAVASWTPPVAAADGSAYVAAGTGTATGATSPSSPALFRSDGTPAGTVRVGVGTFTDLVADGTGGLWMSGLTATVASALWRSVGDQPDSAAVFIPVAPIFAVPGASSIDFAVVYTAADGIDPDSLLIPGAITVTAPDVVASPAVVVAADPGTDPSSRTVTYRWAAPDGALGAADDGSYAVAVAPVVTDVAGVSVYAHALGNLTLNAVATGPSLATTVALSGRPAVTAGGAGVAHVTIADVGPAAADGTVTVQLLLSPTPTPEPGQTAPIISVGVPLRLRPGQRTSVAVRFTYPGGVINGAYSVVAAVDADGALPQVDGTAATAAAALRVGYGPAFADLSVLAATANRVRPGRRSTLVLHLHNGGTAAAKGLVQATLTLSGETLEEPLVLQDTEFRASVPAAGNGIASVPFVLNGVPPGTYTMTIALTPRLSVADSQVSDKSIEFALNVL